LAVTSRPAPAQTAPPDYPAILGNIASFRSAFHVLEDTTIVSERLGELVQRFSVKGRQVHDTSIAATMLTHGLQNLLTPVARRPARGRWELGDFLESWQPGARAWNQLKWFKG
jgi:hypothetical protein